MNPLTGINPLENRLPSYNLSAMLRLAFSIAEPVAYPGVAAQAEKENPALSFQGIRTLTPEEAITTSLGTKALFPITIKGGSYKRYDKDGQVERVQVDEWRLPLSCVTEMSRSKELSRTKMVASKGSVKEVYGHEDWDVKISGFLLNEPNQPQGVITVKDQHERLLELEGLADAVDVLGELFTARKIYRLAIISVQVNQVPGKPGLIPFTLNCVSDDPLELIIQ